jgi:hypothetical protein
MKPTIFALAVLAMLAAPAAAQTRKPAASSDPIGLRIYGLFDLTIPAASKSFDAVFHSRQILGFGGGAEVNVWHTLFLRIAVSHASQTGRRVFVDSNGDLFDLNIPMTVTMTPIEAGGGWRFVSRKSRVTPYIGGAFVSLGYQETSSLAQTTDVVSERYTGGEGFGGADVKIGKRWFVGGEAQYRYIGVPEVSTSVMTQFGETDLGGFTARVLIGFRTK